ncbi:FAD-dependent oxidoreductase [Nitrosomonas marina]|uniref:Selenide, water dikinase n=1 Tax=Nitrosomonas marina TaxID=917 RepID=A0A1H8F2P4_9PROT|nr:FAD-dependent oxidoreductase [Nitrosomonas marina]SEN25989.1 selenide, water dikinase [Nitrosomonas marina]
MKTHTFEKRHLCLIGAGHSHVMVIRQLVTEPLQNTDVTLISPDMHTPYSGMLPGLIAGHYSFEDCHINVRRLCQWAGIRFVRSTVEQINPELQVINCPDFSPIRYDLLSVNIGSRPTTHGILGADKFGCTIKPVRNFLLRWLHWLDSRTESKRKQRIVVVGGGAAGVEVLLAMHYHVQASTTIDTDFTLVSGDLTILTTHNSTVQNYFHRHLQSKGITVRNGKVSSIDEQLLHFQDGSSLDYDFTVWATHAGAYSWPARSGIQCDSCGFIKVNQTLQSISHENIFAAGDCAAFMPQALSKAGVFAVRQGPVLLNNLVASINQKKLSSFKPQQQFLSLITTGARHAIASRGGIFLHGRWVWHWKNFIDSKFMKCFRH